MDSSKKYLQWDTGHVEWHRESHQYFAEISKLKEHSKENKERPEKNKVSMERVTLQTAKKHAQKEKIPTDSNVSKNSSKSPEQCPCLEMYKHLNSMSDQGQGSSAGKFFMEWVQKIMTVTINMLKNFDCTGKEKLLLEGLKAKKFILFGINLINLAFFFTFLVLILKSF